MSSTKYKLVSYFSVHKHFYVKKQLFSDLEGWSVSGLSSLLTFFCCAETGAYI